MIETTGNLWDYHAAGFWVCITTNGFVTRNGECVMGRGVAMQARTRFPQLPKRLGTAIKAGGNHVYLFENLNIASFPVKDFWFNKASVTLIEQSCYELDKFNLPGPVVLPWPGCGNGGLTKHMVRPILKRCLSDKYYVIDLT
jgi:hypothetical protein